METSVSCSYLKKSTTALLVIAHQAIHVILFQVISYAWLCCPNLIVNHTTEGGVLLNAK